MEESFRSMIELGQTGSIFTMSLILTMLRPLGLTIGFIGFAWALPPISLVRTGAAIALGFPILVASQATVLDLIQTNDIFAIMTLAFKEMVIGFLLGFIASIPLLAMQFAGSFIDGYRGEANAEFPDPTGGTVPTYSRLFIVGYFLVFFASGGFGHLITALFDTYEIVPLDEIPTLASGLGDTSLVLGLLNGIFVNAFLIAGPLLFIMVLIDFTTLFVARAAKGFNSAELSFIMRNLIALVSLPLIFMVSFEAVPQNSLTSQDFVPLMERFLK